MYMEALRCKVIGATSTTPVVPAKPPVWCEDDESKCTSGAKQLIFWHQAEGDNIVVTGNDLLGEPKSPGYNAKCGWANGSYFSWACFPYPLKTFYCHSRCTEWYFPDIFERYAFYRKKGQVPWFPPLSLRRRLLFYFVNYYCLAKLPIFLYIIRCLRVCEGVKLAVYYTV